MVFKKCSIGSEDYHGSPPAEEILNTEGEPGEANARVNSTSTDAHQQGVVSSDSTSTAVQDQQTGNRLSPSLLQVERPKSNPETQFYDPELFHDLESAANAEPGKENLALSLDGFFKFSTWRDDLSTKRLNVSIALAVRGEIIPSIHSRVAFNTSQYRNSLVSPIPEDTHPPLHSRSWLH